MTANIKKAYAISDARIQFISLVDKAANKKKFLIAKSRDGSATFQTFGRIIKADTNKHYVTGIVYEPMTEDTDGNYMTEEEITKAAHWFMKHGGDVDLQHCFDKANGVEVVESFVAKSEMDIDGVPIKQGTWLMTMEISNADIWKAIEKGELTGYSMGGMGAYSDVDVDLETIEKNQEPKGLLGRIVKAVRLEGVNKGAVKADFLRRVKEDNFYSAWYALRNALEGSFYNPETNLWEYGYNPDESAIREALEDFNDIVTQILTSDGSIVKSLEKSARKSGQGIVKAGKSLSTRNLETLKGISQQLNEFLSAFEESSEAEGGSEKEEDMNKEEVQKMVGEEIAKALGPVTKQLEAIAKAAGGDVAADSSEQGMDPDTAITPEAVSKMVGEEIAKALAPVTQTLQPLMKSRSLPGNLNDTAGAEIAKGEEPHYMAGMF